MTTVHRGGAAVVAPGTASANSAAVDMEPAITAVMVRRRMSAPSLGMPQQEPPGRYLDVKVQE